MLENVLDATGSALSPMTAETTAKATRRSSRPNPGGAGTRVKNYVLDTNVLLHDPDALLNFQDNNVLLPIEVIEEIDKFKRETTERGQNARAVSRLLDKLRAQGFRVRVRPVVV